MDRSTLIVLAKSVWIFYFFYLVYINEPGKEGNICITESGNCGHCVGIKDCPDALDMLRVGIPRRVCNYEDGYPVVCCKIIPGIKRRLINCNNKQTKPEPETFTKIGSKKRCFPQEFPQLVQLGFDNDGETVWECEGSLISKTFVSTKADCAYSPKFGPVKYVQFGDLNDDKIKPQYFTVSRINKHPSAYHKIAMLELDAEANMTDYVKYVCKKVDDFSVNNEDTSAVFQEIKNRECNPYYTMNEKILQKAIQETYHSCAGNHGKDCKVDPSGPLLTYREEFKKSIHFTEITTYGREYIKSNLEKIWMRINQWYYNIPETEIPDPDPDLELWGGPELRGPQF